MTENAASTPGEKVSSGTLWQRLAVAFCVLFGIALIANNQWCGDATWFWCATLFHGGAKLYSGLHLVYQPFAILILDLWINLFGSRVLVTEVPSVLYLLGLCIGLYLLLRESDWPDWQKAIMLMGCFMLWIAGSSYRFDDYHVMTESFVLYSLIVLLRLVKADKPGQQLWLAVALGTLSGLTITSRINDGAALLVSVLVCILTLDCQRRFIIAGVHLAMALFVAVTVIRCTGDTFSAYIFSTITNASGSKGGSGSLLADPFLLFFNSIRDLDGALWIFVTALAVVLTGIALQRYWKRGIASVVAVQIGLCAVVFLFCPPTQRAQFLLGRLTSYTVPALVLAMYAFAIITGLQLALRKLNLTSRQWNPRSILILVPLAQLASSSLSSGGNPRSSYYAHFAMFLLLLPVLQSHRKPITWARSSLLTLLALVALTQTAAKAIVPYDWDNQRSKPLLTNHTWYRHPVYGPMYIDRDLLQFSQSICLEIDRGTAKPELLSLPFSYPNFFCDTPPWQGYLQTFFDTTRPSTMATLMEQLQTAPPQWIVYQRQLFSMGVQEQSFNHGRPLPQRLLDTLIMDKLASGQWQLVDKKHYQFGDGWYIIRTRP